MPARGPPARRFLPRARLDAAEGALGAGTTLAELPVVALDDVPVGGFLTRGWDTLRLLFR